MKEMFGGPAFPMPGETDAEGGKTYGMSLYEYYAGQALAGMMARNIALNAEEIAVVASGLAMALVKEVRK